MNENENGLPVESDGYPKADEANSIIPLDTTADRVVIEGAAGPVVEYKTDETPASEASESADTSEELDGDADEDDDADDDGEFPADEDEDNAPVYVEGSGDSTTSTTGSEA